MEDKAIYARRMYNPKQPFKSGFFRARRDTIIRVINNKLFTGVVRVEDIPIDIEEGIHEIKLPLIPAAIISEVHNFFKYVYSVHRSEAVILLWHNFQTHEWSVEVPTQITTTASVDYKRIEQDEIDLRAEGFTFVGTIHSHGNMTAFHSSTDDNDEFHFDGLHITMGKIMTDLEFACRFIMKDIELKREPEEVMVIPEITLTIRPDWKIRIENHTTGNNGNTGKNGSLTNWQNPVLGNFPNDPVDDYYSQEILDQIEFNKKQSKNDTDGWGRKKQQPPLHYCPNCGNDVLTKNWQEDAGVCNKCFKKHPGTNWYKEHQKHNNQML